MVFIFVFFTIYLITIVEQCKQDQNMRQKKSYKSAIKKIFVTQKFKKKLMKTDEIFIAETS